MNILNLVKNFQLYRVEWESVPTAMRRFLSNPTRRPVRKSAAPAPSNRRVRDSQARLKLTYSGMVTTLNKSLADS